MPEKDSRHRRRDPPRLQEEEDDEQIFIQPVTEPGARQTTGRVNIPAAVVEKMGLRPGDRLLMRVVPGERTEDGEPLLMAKKIVIKWSEKPTTTTTTTDAEGREKEKPG